MTLQRSALHSFAAESGVLHERHGWELAPAYSDLASEYQAATVNTAVHDASYLGRLKVTGADALDLLNRLSTNKVVDLEPGQGAPTILTTDRGRILDVISVINTGDYSLLITSPGTQTTVISWLDKYTIMEDLTVEDLTATTTMLAVCGPESATALETAGGTVLSHLPPHHTTVVQVDGCLVRVVCHPLAELPCFYLVTSQQDAPTVWRRLIDSGITPMGTAAFEAVQVLCGIPVHGRELGEEFNPLEAGLIGSIDFAKGCYIGQEVIARLDTYKKVQKHLVKLAIDSACPASAGDVLQLDGRTVGKITSVATVPATGERIGLAYVRTDTAVLGTKLEVGEPAAGWAEIRDLPLLFGPGEE